jgi:deoxycytidylate deaminase
VQDYPELFFCLIGAIGTELDGVQSILTSSLEEVGYVAVLHRLSERFDDLKIAPFAELPDRNDNAYREKAIKAGNTFRKLMKRPDAVVGLGLSAIKRDRKNLSGKRVAYIIRSLKRKEEVTLMRSIYGRAAIVISVYSPRDSRIARLSDEYARNDHKHHSDNADLAALKLVQTDENESEDYFGQRVSDTFPLADFFVDSSAPKQMESEIKRFVELCFGNQWITPTKDEQGMAVAHLARLRSASPARQVGAAIAGSKGEILAIGANDVAKPQGGQYWFEDANDARDPHAGETDKSDDMRRNLLGDLLGRLRDLGYLKEHCPAVEVLLDAKQSEGEIGDRTYDKIRGALIFDTIDFVRSVHAEAAALLQLSRTANNEDTLYVTTFPCHECARHIVMSGIMNVIYIEPYPKSLVGTLYKDSIVIDSKDSNKVSFRSFTGVAPSLYEILFSLAGRLQKRKDDSGRLLRWESKDAFPHVVGLRYSIDAALAVEEEALKRFEIRLAEVIQDGTPKTESTERVASGGGEGPSQ